MITTMAISGNTASTFLTHFFGRGLKDERYVVERLQALADRDIRRLPGDTQAKRGRRASRWRTSTSTRPMPNHGRDTPEQEQGA